MSLTLAIPAGASRLTDLVKGVQPAVVTIVTYDLKKEVSGIGSGFFIDDRGHLITSRHVLKNAYSADIKTMDGEKYPIETVVAESEEMDLIKMRVSVPEGKFSWVGVSPDLPDIAENVLVIGSPLGLEQTVSNGIVSAVREVPGTGTFFQMSAPISKGSSGSPVVNMQGKVVGVVTFMLAKGQNLNFAVAGKSILELTPADDPLSVSDWTYRVSLKSPRMAEELCRVGLGYSLEGNYNKALEFYKSATLKDPNDPMAWYGLSHCYHGLKKPDEVVATFRKAIAANPEDALLYYNLGNYYARMSRFEEAVHAYRQSIKINPGNIDAHENLGVSQVRIGHFTDALASLQRVISIKPDHASGHYHMGIALADLGRTEEALAAYKETVRSNPDFLPAYNNMGIIYGQLDRGEEAVEAHKQVIRINPDYAPGHYNLGIAYLVADDRGAALDQYKILKRIDPGVADHLFRMIYP